MKLKDTVIFVLTLIPFFYWAYNYINVDLWYDEIYSLKHFVLVDFKNTFLDYPVPNNHIFFNFVNQILTRLTNCRSLIEIAEKVYLLRLFQGLIALTTGYYSVRIVQRFFKLENSLIILSVLFTTIPFMNFSLQLRGYNMSALFLTMIVYHILAFIEDEKPQNRSFIIICCTLILYTIPSNIYMLGAISIPLIALWLYNAYLNEKIVNIYFKLIFYIGLGVAGATILYLPLMESLLNNPFVLRKFDNPYYSLKIIPRILSFFITERNLLLGLFVIGILVFIYQSSKKEKLTYLMLLFALLFPFVLSFIHHKFPFQRVFMPLSPIFIILISVPIIKLINKLQKPVYIFFSIILLSFYCFTIFYIEIENTNIEVKNEQVNNNRKIQNLYQNYFLTDFFNQKEVMTQLRLIAKSKPVFAYEQLDFHSTDLYLALNEINSTKVKSMEELEPVILKEKEIILITTRKNITLNKLKQLDAVAVKVLTDEDYFTNIISVKKK